MPFYLLFAFSLVFLLLIPFLFKKNDFYTPSLSTYTHNHSPFSLQDVLAKILAHKSFTRVFASFLIVLTVTKSFLPMNYEQFARSLRYYESEFYDYTLLAFPLVSLFSAIIVGGYSVKKKTYERDFLSLTGLFLICN